MLILLYTGPGLGAGVVATVLGIIGSMFLAVFAAVWYPMKRVYRRLRSLGRRREQADGARSDALAD